MSRIGNRIKQKGQAAVLSLVLVLIAATAVVVLYNTAQTANEKTRLVNAADAAAYSGAVYLARNLNFMAYTNRAMIANHISVGHFVNYVSWTRYVADASDMLENIGDIARIIPYVGPAIEVATNYVDMVAGYTMDITENLAEVYVPAVDGLNSAISLAQSEAKFNMLGVTDGDAFTPLYQVMSGAADSYSVDGASININNLDDLTSLDDSNRSTPGTSLVTGAEILNEFSNIASFTKSYTAGNDEGRIESMVNKSLGGSGRWINDRNWRIKMDWIGQRFEKKSDSKLKMQGQGFSSLSDWQAEDEFVHGVFDWSKWKWKYSRLAHGKASAREFDNNYSGVPRYYDMGDPDNPDEHSLTVTAYATVPMNQAYWNADLMGVENTVPRIAALSRAKISYKRPKGDALNGFGNTASAYANLYNPFWEASLSPLRP